MKYNKIFTALMSLLFIGMVSCTDEWNDHYNVQSLGSGTLWDAISSNENLSNFASVLKATNYDRDLASSQVYTVFAPTNDKFTKDQADALIQSYQQELAQSYNNDALKRSKTSTVKEFVMNHIALYNYSVAPETPDTTIRVMNGKFLSFTKSSFSGRNYTSSNVATGNGVLYTIDGEAEYVPSIFEYVKMDAELDSVAKFLYMSNPWQFHVEEFKSSESVAGEIINGKQQYLDSVTVINNSLLKQWLRADLDDEDSTYYTVFPTNEAWKEQLEQNEKYFQYDSQVADRDSFMYVYPRVNILKGMQFSKTSNPKIADAGVDSIMSTVCYGYSARKILYGSYDIKKYQFEKPWAAGGIFNEISGSKECSNGVAMKANKWIVDRNKSTFINNIIMEAESSRTLDSLSGEKQSAKPSWTSTNVISTNPFYNKVSENCYNTLMSSTATMPWVLLDFTNVLSNLDYDLYVVTVPAVAGDTLATDTLPTRFNVTLYWHDAKGKEVNKTITAADGGDIATDTYSKKNTFITNPAIVHKIKIGTFNFPTCSYDVDEPQVKVKIAVNILNSDVTKKIYTKNLRIDRVVLEPHETSATE